MEKLQRLSDSKQSIIDLRSVTNKWELSGRVLWRGHGRSYDVVRPSSKSKALRSTISSTHYRRKRQSLEPKNAMTAPLRKWWHRSWHPFLSVVNFLNKTAIWVRSSKTICSQAVSKPVWHIPIAVCTVKNAWWWTEELSETCRISFQKKTEKLIHLVGFIIRNLSRCTVTWTSIWWVTSLNNYCGK